MLPDAARDRPGPPSAAEAERTLHELATIGERSRRVVHAEFARTPLILWGVAWLVGYTVLDQVPWPLAGLLAGTIFAVAAVGTRLARADEVVSDWQGPVRRSWLALLVCSFFLVVTIGPVPLRTALLFLGALWGVALVLLAIATTDRVLGLLGAVVVIAAAATRVWVEPHGLLVFGMVAGIAMAGLGVRRTWWRR